MHCLKRRSFLVSVCAGTALSAGLPVMLGQVPSTPPVLPSRRGPGERDEPETPPAATTKAVLEQRQKDMKKAVEKLFDLASELKADVDKTDATAVLSLAMLKKTEEIEKLARQIREHAKG
jgi:hypothetical protein